MNEKPWDDQIKNAAARHVLDNVMVPPAERAPRTMIKIGDLTINPAFVASMRWDHRHYMNGFDSVLVVRMADGQEHRIKHEPQYLGGANAYEVERSIELALKMAR